jgi:tetratricopeptide (TPR) repeat protein
LAAKVLVLVEGVAVMAGRQDSFEQELERQYGLLTDYDRLLGLTVDPLERERYRYNRGIVQENINRLEQGLPGEPVLEVEKVLCETVTGKNLRLPEGEQWYFEKVAGRDVIEAAGQSGVINTGRMGNVNSGSGPQTNIGQQKAEQITNIQQQTVVTGGPERVCPGGSLAAPERFGGRDGELRELMEKLKREQVVAITALEGLGGIGKTTLARKLAYELYHEQGAERCFRAVLWLDVTSEPNEERLLLELGGQVEVGFSRRADEEAGQLARRVQLTLQQAIEGRCEHCRFDRVLLVLDDVWENGLELVGRLKGLAPPKTTTLITTRFVTVATGLGVKRSDQQALGRLSKEAGAELLAEYLPEEIGPEGRLALAEVLHGYTLALKLAAMRLSNEIDPPAELEYHLAQYRRELPAGADFAGLELELGQDKEHNLTKSLYYSYAALSDQEQARFRALGVLTYNQPFDLALLARLWELSEEEAKKPVRRLWQLALLEEYRESGAEAQTGASRAKPGWYQIHPVLQSYARALLGRDKAEYEDALGHYRDYITEVAGQFDKPPEEWGQLGPYLPHIQAVGDGLAGQLEAGGGLDDTALVERAMAFAYNTTRYVRMRMELHLEWWLEMGLATSRKLQNQRRESLFLNELGLVYDALGEKHKALQYYEQVLPLQRVVGDRGGEASTLNNIGLVYHAWGEMDKALECYQEALPMHRAVGNRTMEATTLNNIGRVYHALGEMDKALEYYEQALPLQRAVGDRGGEASTLNNIGLVYHAWGEMDKALQYYQQALPLQRAVGDRSGEAVTCFNMAMVYRNLGQLEKAVAFLERCVELDEQIRHPDLESDRAMLQRVRAELAHQGN